MTPEELKNRQAGDIVVNSEGERFFLVDKNEETNRMTVCKMQEVGINGWGFLPGRPQSFIDKLPSTMI